MIKGVFFDLYGTLLIYNDLERSQEDGLLEIYKYLRNLGLKISKKSFNLKWDLFVVKAKNPIKKEHLTIFENKIYDLSIEIGLKLEDDEIRLAANKGLNTWQKYITLDPNAIPILKILKKDKILALITNFDHPPHVNSLLTKLELRDFFDSIVISGEVGVKKPNPQILSFALKQTKLQPSEVCYVGDTIEDVEAAYNAKISPILIERQNVVKNELSYDDSIGIKYAKKIISLKDLIKIVY